eukprot:CAMPEP_0174252588 /NCGR_PEP_ID=MMETSP0439-20130205/1991_1 /TAXON_ID=0 /ORGANISM="Stereomyxa ramosa, Strain Chinc5" /LENGTH=587 /DNA_ID=CAMNT_0015333145 /DNA_START=62 /DNA_END=1825 /DNA_ORIENTATION=+
MASNAPQLRTNNNYNNAPSSSSSPSSSSARSSPPPTYYAPSPPTSAVEAYQIWKKIKEISKQLSVLSESQCVKIQVGVDKDPSLWYAHPTVVELKGSLSTLIDLLIPTDAQPQNGEELPKLNNLPSSQEAPMAVQQRQGHRPMPAREKPVSGPWVASGYSVSSKQAQKAEGRAQYSLTGGGHPAGTWYPQQPPYQSTHYQPNSRSPYPGGSRIMQGEHQNYFGRQMNSGGSYQENSMIPQVMSRATPERYGYGGWRFTTTSGPPTKDDNSRDKTKGKGRRGRQPVDDTNMFCFHCGVVETPEWRRGPAGPRTLCNACGLQYAKRLKESTQRKDATLNMLLNAKNVSANSKEPPNQPNSPSSSSSDLVVVGPSQGGQGTGGGNGQMGGSGGQNISGSSAASSSSSSSTAPYFETSSFSSVADPKLVIDNLSQHQQQQQQQQQQQPPQHHHQQQQQQRHPQHPQAQQHHQPHPHQQHQQQQQQQMHQQQQQQQHVQQQAPQQQQPEEIKEETHNNNTGAEGLHNVNTDKPEPKVDAKSPDNKNDTNKLNLVDTNHNTNDPNPNKKRKHEIISGGNKLDETKPLKQPRGN